CAVHCPMPTQPSPNLARPATAARCADSRLPLSGAAIAGSPAGVPDPPGPCCPVHRSSAGWGQVWRPSGDEREDARTGTPLAAMAMARPWTLVGQPIGCQYTGYAAARASASGRRPIPVALLSVTLAPSVGVV